MFQECPKLMSLIKKNLNYLKKYSISSLFDEFYQISAHHTCKKVHYSFMLDQIEHINCKSSSSELIVSIRKLTLQRSPEEAWCVSERVVVLLLIPSLISNGHNRLEAFSQILIIILI